MNTMVAGCSRSHRMRAEGFLRYGGAAIIREGAGKQSTVNLLLAALR